MEVNASLMAEPPALKTRGVGKYKHVIDFRKWQQWHPGDLVIREIFKEIFTVRTFQRYGRVTCTIDTIVGGGRKDHYQDLNGVLYIGCLYCDVDCGVDIACNLFVRRCVDCRGPMDFWKEDIEYPYGILKYSVFAVYPPGYVLTKKAITDPRAHTVAAFTWEELKERGIDLEVMLDHMVEPEFAYGD